MQHAQKTLRYAVRPRTLVKYLGLLAVMLASLALVPLLVSLVAGESDFTLRYLLVIALLLGAGLPTLRLEHPSDIQHNESLVITALAFLLAPLVMSYPMMGSGLGFADAWFEAVSAITTTGLTTLTDLEQMPRTFLFARAWMQWYGGLGIVVLSVAILMNHRITLRRLVNPGGESMVTTTRLYARRVLVVYSVLTLLGLGLLLLLLDAPFLALTHTLAAVSTGGFSPLNDSIATLDWPAQLGVTLLGLSGAIPFILYYRLSRGSWREVVGDIEVRTLFILLLLVSLTLTVALHDHGGQAGPGAMGWQEAGRHGLLLGLSAQTTTGFASLDPAQLSTATLGVLMVAMLIGGSVGSTAGGIKVLRLLILLRLIQRLIQRTALPPHAVLEPRLGDKVLEGDEIERALLLILLFVLIIALAWLLFIAYGYAPIPALFELVSAAATVGLSSGITSAALEPELKGVLGALMLLGRLEVIALLVVLYPGTWLGRRAE